MSSVNVSILTPDSKMPNLAAMKISAWHKANGDNVELNFPLMQADMTYASIIFKDTALPPADLYGGPSFPESKLEPEMDSMMPDYSLYPSMDYSLGYTYKACPRTCDFCIVPKQHNSEDHYSIWSFHDRRFSKIALLNNNTLADPYCRETFDELIDAKLTAIDHSGFDLRLMTEEFADYISRIKWQGYIHCAWDEISHEEEIYKGICLMKKAGIKNIMCYVLIGNGNTKAEDLHRVMCLWQDLGVDPFVMPMDKDCSYQRRFARWCNFKAIFKTVEWRHYR